MTDEFEAKVRACSAHDSQTPLLDRSVEAELRDHSGGRRPSMGLRRGG